MGVRLTAVALGWGLTLAGGGLSAALAADTTFLLNASVDCCAAGEHEFGWLGGSATGIDPADVPEPPPPLGSHLMAAFRLPGVASPERWRRDFRAPADFAGDGRESWDLSFAVSALPATCTVTVTAGQGDPSGLLLLLSGACSDTLAIPASVSFPLGSDTHLYLEIVAEALPVGGASWGDVKCRFR